MHEDLIISSSLLPTKCLEPLSLFLNLSDFNFELLNLNQLIAQRDEILSY